MNRVLLVLVAAVGLSGCIVHPIGLRPPPPPGMHQHRHHGHDHHPDGHAAVYVDLSR